MLAEVAQEITALGVRMSQYAFAILACIPFWALIIALNRKDFEEMIGVKKK